MRSEECANACATEERSRCDKAHSTEFIGARRMGTASAKTQKPAAAQARDASPDASFEALRGRITGVGEQFTAAYQQLESLDRELHAWVESLEQREAASSILAGELEQRESQLAARIAEAEGQLAQAESQRQEIERARGELAAQQQQLESEKSRIDARSAELDAAQAELERKNADLETERGRIAQEREALNQLHAGLEAREAALAEQQAAFDARQEEFKATLATIELRETAVSDREAALVVREEAIARFQNAFSGMAALFGNTKGGASNAVPDLGAMAALAGMAGGNSQAAVQAASELAAAASSLASVKEGGSQNSTAAPSQAGDGVATDHGAGSHLKNSAGPGTASAESPPVSPVKVIPPVNKSADLPAGAIDESKLDPEELEKLRVLRRLTGGRKSDAELLERIRKEKGARSGDGGGSRGGDSKSKKRWWN